MNPVNSFFAKIFTPARLTLIVTFLGAAATVVLASVKAFPGGAWPNIAVAIAGVLQHAVAVVKFLDGNSNWETASLYAAPAPAPVVAPAPVPDVGPMVRAEFRRLLANASATDSPDATFPPYAAPVPAPMTVPPEGQST